MRTRSEAFARYDETQDGDFYIEPRFVEHIDERAIEAVEQLYRDHLPASGAILDLMSSWVSHLPPEATYRFVAGLGMNAAELATNPRLNSYVVHDLNAQPRLPFATTEFDAVTICVSIQYLTQPAAVLREAARVAKTGAPIVITFSNRCFPTKAVAIWQMLSDRDRCNLIAGYLREARGWENIESLDRSSSRGDPLYAVVARRSALLTA